MSDHLGTIPSVLYTSNVHQIKLKFQDPKWSYSCLKDLDIMQTIMINKKLKRHTLHYDMKDQQIGYSWMCVPLTINRSGISIFTLLPYFSKGVKERWGHTCVHVGRKRGPILISYRSQNLFPCHHENCNCRRIKTSSLRFGNQDDPYDWVS